MVCEQLEARGIKDAAVLYTMRKVERHRFVPRSVRDQAYDDRPLPIGPEQTISQPYVVAYMLQELKLTKSDRVLEIGTGSGYQTALLAELAGAVCSLELDPRLARLARRRLRVMAYGNVDVRCGDGWQGWPGEERFAKIIVSAACREIPRSVTDQLSDGGRMVLPFGADEQQLILIERLKDRLNSKNLGAVRFVKMQGDPR